jgi:hypothetical protein
MKCTQEDLEKLKDFVKKVERGKFTGIVAVNECRVVKGEKYGNVDLLLVGGKPDDLLFLCENLLRFLRERMKDTPKRLASRKFSSTSCDINYIG